MVKLTTPDDTTAAFFFKDMNACNEFKYVFSNHWCNITWNTPEEQEVFPEATTGYWRDHINDDPKKLADKHLMWGFSRLKFLGRDKELTASQSQFVNDMVEKITKENEGK